MENWNFWYPLMSDYNFRIGGFYPAASIADFNQDTDVDIEDLLTLAENWLRTNCGPCQWCELKDMDCSGSVDIADFAILSSHWLD